MRSESLPTTVYNIPPRSEKYIFSRMRAGGAGGAGEQGEQGSRGSRGAGGAGGGFIPLIGTCYISEC